MLRAIALAITCAFTLAPPAAWAQYRPPPPGYHGFLPPTEARGCYYWRGQEFCGSYCYWEINGKRYCQPRLRDAFSQAAPEHVFEAAPRPYGRLK